jgi:hypothetical protein
VISSLSPSLVICSLFLSLLSLLPSLFPSLFLLLLARRIFRLQTHHTTVTRGLFNHQAPASPQTSSIQLCVVLERYRWGGVIEFVLEGSAHRVWCEFSVAPSSTSFWLFPVLRTRPFLHFSFAPSLAFALNLTRNNIVPRRQGRHLGRRRRSKGTLRRPSVLLSFVCEVI